MARVTVKRCLFGTACLLISVFVCFYPVLLQAISEDFYIGKEVDHIFHGMKLGDYLNLDWEDVKLPLHCKTCALVGTSGHLLNSELGQQIDRKHTCIFRLGFAPTRGMEDHVGARTTVRIVDSFRFYPFLKKPSKLFTGPFPAEHWIVFDKRMGDITKFHRPFLKPLMHKYDSQFLWMSRQAEWSVYESLKNLTSSRKAKVSALWFATKVIEDADCQTLDVYGIPDPNICKRELYVPVPSLYWENSSHHLCFDGDDASFALSNSPAPVPTFPSIIERKALLKWARKHVYQINFRSPSWPSFVQEVQY